MLVSGMVDFGCLNILTSWCLAFYVRPCPCQGWVCIRSLLCPTFSGRGNGWKWGRCMLFFFTPPKNATRYTLPKTNIFAPGNRWLEDDCFLFGWPIFRCYVRFGGDIYIYVCVCPPWNWYFRVWKDGILKDPKRKIVFQATIFRGENASFREGIYNIYIYIYLYFYIYIYTHI